MKTHLQTFSAPVGTYYVTIKVSDAAGNEARQTGAITVAPLSYLQIIPPFIPPTDSLLPEREGVQRTDEGAPPVTSFGGTTTRSMGAVGQSVLLSTGASSSSTLPQSNILWGAVAAALIGWATASAL